MTRTATNHAPRCCLLIDDDSAKVTWRCRPQPAYRYICTRPMIGVLHFALSGDAVSVFLDKPSRVTELHAFYARIWVVCPIIWYYKRAGWSFVLVTSSRYI